MRAYLYRRRLYPHNKARYRGEANSEEGYARDAIERGKRRVILLTTSRKPTNRLRTLCHDLARTIPNVIRINRGKLNLDGVAEKALELNAHGVIIIDRWKGGPGKIKLFQVDTEGLILVPPLIFVEGIRLQREIGEVRGKSVRSLTITTSHEKSSQLLKITEALSSFLNIPRLTPDEAASGYEAAMQVSYGSSTQILITFLLLPSAEEIGPRVVISHVVWKVKR